MKKALGGLILLGLAAYGVWRWQQQTKVPASTQTSRVMPPVGTKRDAFHGVVVYSNGEVFTESHGRHYAPDGYYYGQRWQCVEYVKRFYHQHFRHHMPDVMGHARDFYDAALPHGALSPRRHLHQYLNGQTECPRVGDLMLFPTMAKGYGHVAIVSDVGQDFVEVIQQNTAETRWKMRLHRDLGQFRVEHEHCAGWLRIPVNPVAR